MEHGQLWSIIDVGGSRALRGACLYMGKICSSIHGVIRGSCLGALL